MLIRLMVRRFFCTDVSCERKIFAEQPDLASRYARRTQLAGDVLESVALALGGRPGARMTGALEVPVNRMTLLRIIRRIPDGPVQVPDVLGVDDFAIREPDPDHRRRTLVRMTAAAEQLSAAIFEPVIRATAAHAAGHTNRQLRDIAAFLAAHRNTLEHYLDASPPAHTAGPDGAT
ncbi:hypothetical protein GCM10022255_094120 [Dactylosporangium darangshiense]|uniref:Transposase n=1 Tax=Dactylosporangium darangshiense TaxID=579108 RepID=A0ABP8DPX8_9ACTN